MKKLLLYSCIFMGCASTASYGQSSSTPITVETVTSLKPADSKTMTFSSEKELELALSEKLVEYKLLVVEHQNNPTLATFYRQEIWRLENAVVVTKN